ncbi:hypothetical protein GIW58_07025 [Pseudomonas gessardii]|uniref:hypothetical protein n=1 Tax=Pseudomonas gessardii TaxID=78544 RepID=UPI001F285C36|nr:hypothetical protein [Pseudomonas gessardii]MCF5094535.1 hypothetical protein [Pseudomonas gessardii]
MLKNNQKKGIQFECYLKNIVFSGGGAMIFVLAFGVSSAMAVPLLSGGFTCYSSSRGCNGYKVSTATGSPTLLRSKSGSGGEENLYEVCKDRETLDSLIEFSDRLFSPRSAPGDAAVIRSNN